VRDAEEGTAEAHRQPAPGSLVERAERERAVAHLLLEADEQEHQREQQSLASGRAAGEREDVHPGRGERGGVHGDRTRAERDALGQTPDQSGPPEESGLPQGASLHPPQDHQENQDIDDGHQDTRLDGALQPTAGETHQPVEQEAEEPGEANCHPEAPRPEARREKWPGHVRGATRRRPSPFHALQGTASSQ